MVPGPKKGNGGGVWAIVGGLLPLAAAGGTYYVLDPKLPPILQPIARAIYSSHISRGAIGHEAVGWQRALADRRTGRVPRNRPFRGRGVALGRVLQRKIAVLMKTKPTIKAAQL